MSTSTPEPTPYPGYGAAPQYSPPVEPRGLVPASIETARKLMYAGAGLSLLSLLPSLLFRGELRSQTEAAARDAGQSLTGDQLDTAMTIGLVTAGVMALVSAGLWVLHGVLAGKGVAWSRITATVLYVIFVLLSVLSVFGEAPLLSRLITLLSLLVGGAAVYLLWRKDSSAWFSRPTAG